MFVGVEKANVGRWKGVHKVKVGRCDWNGSVAPKQLSLPDSAFSTQHKIACEIMGKINQI